MADIKEKSNNIPELQSPFDPLREIDADGKEWWNSRKLSRVMSHGKCRLMSHLVFNYRTNG